MVMDDMSEVPRNFAPLFHLPVFAEAAVDVMPELGPGH